MQFTRDTSKVLVSIYKIFLDRRKNGMARSDAIKFDKTFYKDVKALAEWSDSDISCAIHELRGAGFLRQNILGGFTLEDALILQMENRFKTGSSEVAKYLLDLVSGVAPGLFF